MQASHRGGQQPCPYVCAWLLALPTGAGSTPGPDTPERDVYEDVTARLQSSAARLPLVSMATLTATLLAQCRFLGGVLCATSALLPSGVYGVPAAVLGAGEEAEKTGTPPPRDAHCLQGETTRTQINTGPEQSPNSSLAGPSRTVAPLRRARRPHLVHLTFAGCDG